MSTFLGMDTDLAREQGRGVARGADQVELLRGQLEAALGTMAWQGPDAEVFAARWREVMCGPALLLSAQLVSLAAELASQADQQDAVSAPEPQGAWAGGGQVSAMLPTGPGAPSPSGPGSPSTPSGPGTGPGAGASPPPQRGWLMSGGYLHDDNPLLQDDVESAVESTLSRAWGGIMDGADRTSDALLDLAGRGAERLGMPTAGIAQLDEDVDHLEQETRDLLTGERSPAIAELAASGAVVGGSGIAAATGLVTGKDSAFMDAREDVQVRRVTRTGPTASAGSLAQMIYQEDQVRREMFGRTGSDAFDPAQSAQVRVQRIAHADGGADTFVVQIPPSQGGAENPDAWGAQGNPFGWDANLREMAGQETASMSSVRTAMREAGVPDGAQVMLVGHSQGGIVGAHLAARDDFNSASGAAGTYDVTTSFSVGSPVQTVIPSQGSTQVVNVSRGPFLVHVPGLLPLSMGDAIPTTDLGGLQLDGVVGSPSTHEVRLPGSISWTYDPIHGSVPFLDANHESVVRDENGQVDPRGGYYGSLRAHQDTDPTLVGLRRDIDGVYMGEGTTISSETVVEVSRGTR